MNRKESKAWIKKKCGDGWLPLIDSVYDNKPDHIKITDIYQKWGALVFDSEPWDENFENFLDKINKNSMKHCEVCGSKGEGRNVDSWVFTLCKNHYLAKFQ